MTMAVGTRARSFLRKMQVYNDNLVKMECILPVTTEYLRPESTVITKLV
jgi:pyruvoyl-dependent arginine decarboxylase (PvlArgDC)